MTLASAGSLLVAQGFKAQRTLTFDGNASFGAIGNVPLFTVSGEILILSLIPFCTTDLVGATATLALGVTGATALFIAATTATDIDANEFWVDTTPDANGVAIPAGLKDVASTDNIVGTGATAAITAGVIRFDLFWLPLSADAAGS